MQQFTQKSPSTAEALQIQQGYKYWSSANGALTSQLIAQNEYYAPPEVPLNKVYPIAQFTWNSLVRIRDLTVQISGGYYNGFSITIDNNQLALSSELFSIQQQFQTPSNVIMPGRFLSFIYQDAVPSNSGVNSFRWYTRHASIYGLMGTTSGTPATVYDNEIVTMHLNALSSISLVINGYTISTDEVPAMEISVSYEAIFQ